jgi:hypothetical protein
MYEFVLIVSSLLLTIITIIGGFLVLRDTKNKNGKWGINLKKNQCPKCGELFPQIRIPSSLKQAMWGDSKCKSCGCEVDKWGNEKSIK